MHGNLKQRVVMCHGCFDGLHLGHIRHLQEARALGDRLVVSVTADHFINKGVGRPRFTAAERVEALKALECVDDAFVSHFPSAVESIRVMQPAFYVKGCDYEGGDQAGLSDEVAAVTSYGGRFHTTKTEKLSSSRLINGQRFEPKVVDYLESARKRGFLDRIKSAFDRADKLRIAFVGESIIDEYRYVVGLGRPSKELILATALTSTEAFRGGIHAASLHADWSHVSICTVNQPIKKTRFVDRDFKRKLFEVYSAAELNLADVQRTEFRKRMSAVVRESDVVVVMDFGHGLMTPLDRAIVNEAKFLAANAQTNAANIGFNKITNYPGAHLACIDEPEARLATGIRGGEARKLVTPLARYLTSKNIIVTLGKSGCLSWNRTWLSDIPAFSFQTVDTIGAGDAFLATVAPLVAVGLELEAAAFAGNVAGAIKTTIVGHRSHVTRDQLMQNVEALLA